MKKQIVAVIVLLALAAFACSFSPSSLFATPTPVPSQTPLPTYTPQPTFTPMPTFTPLPTFTPIPTATEVPSILGVDVPLEFDNVSMYFKEVFLTAEYNFPYTENGVSKTMTFTPNDSNDRVLVIIFDAKGSIANANDWPQNQNVWTTNDNNRKDQLWYSITNTTTGLVEFLFIVDSKGNHVLNFSDGQTIDLATFLK